MAVGGGFQETGQTSGQAWADGHGYAVTGDGGGVNPGAGGLDGEVIDEKTSFEIVGTIQDEVETGEEFFNVAGVYISDQAFNSDAAIDGAEFALRCDSLGKSGAGVVFVEQSLPLQIGWLDEITVNDPDLADSGAHEETGGRRADGAATHDDRAGAKQALLPVFTDPGEKHLTRVLFV